MKKNIFSRERKTFMTEFHFRNWNKENYDYLPHTLFTPHVFESCVFHGCPYLFFFVDHIVITLLNYITNRMGRPNP
jgi:hypothetical protein